MTLIAVIPFALTGLDPFKAGVPVLIGIGSFGIIFLQAFAAIAILVYLRRRGGEPLWVMVATWFGTIGLIGATIFVGIYFKFLATSDAALIGLLPLIFPLVVIPFAILSVLLRFVRPKSPQDGAAADDPASSPSKLSTDADSEFLIRDTAAGAAAVWIIKYKNVAGSEFTSASKPSFEVALAEARNLRDQRGAKILELIGLPVDGNGVGRDI